LKRPIIAGILCFSVAFLSVNRNARAQDIHYPDVQAFAVWYNPAVKTDKEALAHIDYAHVNYPGVLGYTNFAATVEVPFVGRERKQDPSAAFSSVSAGVTNSSSTGSYVTATSAMLAFSYALPLDYHFDFLALGFQGAYNSSQIQPFGSSHWPSNFDHYGPIGSAAIVDPDLSGHTITYYTVGTGFCFFHNGDEDQWHVGFSARQLNRPLTDPTFNPPYRLPILYGIQAGYTREITDQDAIGYYGNLSFQPSTNDAVIGAFYRYTTSDSLDAAGTIGVAVRFDDAILPYLKIRLDKNEFGGYYFVNISHAAASYYQRSAFDLVYTRRF
jgi:hypothetical protein